jgi:glycosyltransferase involved in cell wall biosynthesis
MPSKLQFAFVVTEDWYFVSHRLSLATETLKRGCHVAVFTRCREKVSVIADAGIKAVNFEMKRRGMNLIGIFQEIADLWRLLRQYRPDIVHLVALRPVVVGGLASLVLSRPQFVFALTGLGYLFTAGRENSQTTKLFKRMLPILVRKGLAIVQNTDDQDVLLGCGVDSSRIHLIRGSGVDVKKFLSSDEPPGVPIVMLPARMLWDKGVGEFVKAARILRARGVDARFVLVGESDPDNPTAVPREAYRKWADEGAVEMWGFQERMHEVLPQATIVCLPSYREGMPKSLLEAMACGRPCITTDAPGCREAVHHNDNGLVVPVKDVSALTESIQQLLDSKTERLRMGRRGRQRAIEEFADEVINTQTLAVYEKLLAKKL